MALIIDLTRMLAGPFGTQILGDLGHEIIKVEQERIGDATRRNPPYVEGVSAYFFAANRNKKSIIINLKKPEGRDLLLDLVRQADVVFENFRPGVMESLRLTYDDLRAVNPDVIHVSVTGFGSWGSLRDKISFDVVGQAISGAMTVTTPDEGEPIKPAIPMADLGAGIYGVLAVLRALLERDTSGGGRHLEVSLLDVMLAFSSRIGEDYLINDRGDEIPRLPAPNGLFPTADGHISLAAYSDAAWRTLCAMPELGPLDRVEFADAEQRMRHREELDAELGQRLRTRTTAEWTERFSAAGVLASPIADMGDVFSNEHLAQRGMLPVIGHPVVGELEALGNPMLLETGGYRTEIDAPPRHGQHTREILRDRLGLDDAEIEKLIAQQVVTGLVPEKV